MRSALLINQSDERKHFLQSDNVWIQLDFERGRAGEDDDTVKGGVGQFREECSDCLKVTVVLSRWIANPALPAVNDLGPKRVVWAAENPA